MILIGKIVAIDDSNKLAEEFASVKVILGTNAYDWDKDQGKEVVKPQLIQVEVKEKQFEVLEGIEVGDTVKATLNYRSWYKIEAGKMGSFYSVYKFEKTDKAIPDTQKHDLQGVVINKLDNVNFSGAYHKSCISIEAEAVNKSTGEILFTQPIVSDTMSKPLMGDIAGIKEDDRVEITVELKGKKAANGNVYTNTSLVNVTRTFEATTTAEEAPVPTPATEGKLPF